MRLFLSILLFGILMILSVNAETIGLKVVDYYSCQQLTDGLNYSSCNELDAGYLIKRENLDNLNGLTQKGKWTYTQNLDIGGVYTIYGFKDNYYTARRYIFGINENSSIKEYIPLRKAGKINLHTNHTLKKGLNFFRLEFSPEGYYQKTGICFGWHDMVVERIDIGGTPQIPVPVRLRTVTNRCYDFDWTFDPGNNYSIDILLEVDKLKYNGFLNITFFDKDLIITENSWFYAVENPETSEDLGGRDYSLIIKKEALWSKFKIWILKTF